MKTIEIGASAEYTHVVRSQDCATAWANDLPVLATPVLLWLVEVAAMRVLDEALAPGEMSVGAAHTHARHLAATPAGWTVTARAVLTGLEGMTYEFAVETVDEAETVFSGTHVRAVINRERFLRRLHRKAPSADQIGTPQC